MSDEEFLFLKAIIKLHLNKGDTKEFICPICKSKAYAHRASTNGHTHAKCFKCNLKTDS